MPWLNELRARYAERGLVIVGVNVDAERSDAEKFLRDVPVSFDVVFDPGGALAQKFKVPGMPATYLFDRRARWPTTISASRTRSARRSKHAAGIAGTPRDALRGIG